MNSWNARIEEATNPMDLLAVARDYLDSWEPEDLALIPEAARPQRIKGVDDLTYWHQKLVECFCSSSLGAGLSAGSSTWPSTQRPVLPTARPSRGAA